MLTAEQTLTVLDKIAKKFDKADNMTAFHALNNAKIAVKRSMCSLSATSRNSVSINTFRCPDCNRILAVLGKNEFDVKGYGFVDYCPHCGQKIDWGEARCLMKLL